MDREVDLFGPHFQLLRHDMIELFHHRPNHVLRRRGFGKPVGVGIEVALH